RERRSPPANRRARSYRSARSCRLPIELVALAQQVEGAPDIGDQRLAARFDVARLDGLHQRMMVVGGRRVTPCLEYLSSLADIGAGLQPEALDDGDQHVRAGGAIDAKVEVVVEVGSRARRLDAASGEVVVGPRRGTQL